MPNINDLSTIEEKIDRASKITRRDAARRLLAGIAAGAVLPSGIAAHPIWKHFEDEHLMSLADAMEDKLHFLNAKQVETLSAVSETIVPGSTKANVAGFIDLLLSVESEKHQREFVSSLARMEAKSAAQYGIAFSALSATERNEIMTRASAQADVADADDEKLREAFDKLKEWISGAYYSSEIGMRELGWTPDRVFAEFRGCSHAEGHG